MEAEYKWKVVMVGDIAVGKTSLVRRFVFDEFSDTYLTTIGVKVTKKEMSIQGFPRSDILLWDIAGSDRFAEVSPEYINGALGGVIVADVTRKSTVENISAHADSISNLNPDIKIVVALNKGDLSDRHEECINSARDILARTAYKAAPIFITSAKNGENVEAMFLQLVRLIHRSE